MAAAAAAPGASADDPVVARTPGFVNAGPVLAGGGFVFADERGRQTRVHVVSGSGASRVLSQFPRMVTRSTEEDESGELDYTEIALALDASRAGVAVGIERSSCHRAPSGDSDCFAVTSEYWLSRYRGRARRVLRCEGTARDTAVSGSVAAVLGCPSRSGASVHLFDVARGTVLRTLRPPRGYGFVDLDVAGPYVAAEAAGPRREHAILVVDARTGKEVFRAPSSPLNEGEFALQADGKLLVPGDEGAPECANWYSPAEPAPHPLAFRPCLGALGADRIVTVAEADENNVQLVLTDLRGSAPVALTPPAELANATPYDFDGRRIVEAVAVCRGYYLVAERLRDILRRGPRRAQHCQRG